MKNNASSAIAVNAAPIRALVLLAMLCAVLAVNAFFIAAPGDGGSGIGGTGKFGGESGMGGTGGPVNLGAAVDREEDRASEAGPAPAGLLAHSGTVRIREADQSPRVDMSNLRLTPEAASLARPPALPEGHPGELDEALADIASQNRDEELRGLRAAGFPEPDSLLDSDSLASSLENRVDALIARESSTAARETLNSSLEITRQLILAEAATEVPLPGLEAEDEGVDELLDEGRDQERVRLSLPARPERPDRPSVPARRFSPPQRDIPAPPVRPMRI